MKNLLGWADGIVLCLNYDNVRWVYTFAKLIKLYTLNEQILLYVNHTSEKFFFSLKLTLWFCFYASVKHVVEINNWHKKLMFISE